MDRVIKEFAKKGFESRKIGSKFIFTKNTSKGFASIAYRPGGTLSYIQLYKDQELLFQRFFGKDRDPVDIVNRLTSYYD